MHPRGWYRSPTKTTGVSGVRSGYLNSDKLGLISPFYGTEAQGFSRLMLNGWLMIQAAFSGVSGINAVNLASGYLVPALVLFSLLAFYWLARTLFEDEGAALFAGALYGFSCSSTWTLPQHRSVGTSSGACWKTSSPPGTCCFPWRLASPVLYLRKRGWLRLGMFALVFWATGRGASIGPGDTRIGCSGARGGSPGGQFARPEGLGRGSGAGCRGLPYAGSAGGSTCYSREALCSRS